MFAEVNKLVARYGVDARDFTLLPFGGAGPMLGCLLARELGMARVLVPRRPGVVSALGGLIADVKCDFIRTMFLDLDDAHEGALRDALASVTAEAERWLRNEQGFAGEATLSISADMRYRGQSFEIEVTLEAGWIAAGDLAAMREAFHDQHTRLYDFADTAAPVQLVNLRAVIAGRTQAPSFPQATRHAGLAAPDRSVTVWQAGVPTEVPVYRREALRHGEHFAGPAIVVQEDSTVCVPADYDTIVDGYGNLHLVATPGGRH